MDLEFLRPLYDRMGGYVSVYLDTSREGEEAGEVTDLRWRAAREQLASAGADDATLDALAAVLTSAGRDAPGHAAFGCGGAALLAEPLPDRPRREIARVAPLPHVMPLLAQRRPRVPHLRVMARHDGGEIAAVTGAGHEQDEQVTGTGWPIHKVKSGGMSQLRYQRSAEDAWETNAKELAGRVTEAAREVGAELIVVTGDPVARSLLLRELGVDLAAITVIVDREVSADSDEAKRAADEAVAGYLARRSLEQLDHWRTQLAHGHGVEGLGATVAALRDGAVAELLLADHPESAATAWIGPRGTDLALSVAELTELGVADPVTDRADAAIARALATTDAQLYVLPEGAAAPADGVGAVLRFPVPE